MKFPLKDWITGTPLDLAWAENAEILILVSTREFVLMHFVTDLGSPKLKEWLKIEANDLRLGPDDQIRAWDFEGILSFKEGVLLVTLMNRQDPNTVSIVKYHLDTKNLSTVWRGSALDSVPSVAILTGRLPS
jgi:hypothetical protein